MGSLEVSFEYLFHGSSHLFECQLPNDSGAPKSTSPGRRQLAAARWGDEGSSDAEFGTDAPEISPKETQSGFIKRSFAWDDHWGKPENQQKQLRLLTTKLGKCQSDRFNLYGYLVPALWTLHVFVEIVRILRIGHTKGYSLFAEGSLQATKL